jgi:hypothetical protein
MNNQVVPEHRPRIEVADIAGLAALIILVLVLIGVVFALNWNSWGKPATMIVSILLLILALWKAFTVLHDRALHHATVRQTHLHAKMQRQLAEKALAMGHSVELKHTDHLGGIHEFRSVSPLTIPNAPVTIKEMNFGTEQDLLPAPLPIAPPFRSLISQIKPGHLFLGQGATRPIWGDITDLLSTLDVGRPGTGKSTLLRDVCGQVLLIGGQPIIFDPHGSILDDLGSSFECAESPRDIVEYAHVIDSQLTQRLASRRAGRANFKPVLLLVDEMPIISEMAPDALPVIRRVVLEGRKVGMYALISGQGVPASILGGTLVRDAMASRYVFCTSPQQARMAGLENETAKSMMAILEEAGPGKAVLATSNRKPEIVAIPDTTTDDIRYIVSRNGNETETAETASQANPKIITDLFPASSPAVESSVNITAGVGNEIRETIKRMRKGGLIHREIAPLVGLSGRKYSIYRAVCQEEGIAVDQEEGV